MESETTTGTRDIVYDVVSVLYHALEAADTCQEYVRDAEAEGNEELILFFREVIDQNRQLAERAKGVLRGQIGEEIDERSDIEREGLDTPELTTH